MNQARITPLIKSICIFAKTSFLVESLFLHTIITHSRALCLLYRGTKFQRRTTKQFGEMVIGSNGENHILAYEGHCLMKDTLHRQKMIRQSVSCCQLLMPALSPSLPACHHRYLCKVFERYFCCSTPSSSSRVLRRKYPFCPLFPRDLIRTRDAFKN